MAALDFPDNPSTGTTYDKWTWNGSMWVFTNGVGAGYTFVQEFTPIPTKQGDTWFDTSTTAAGGTSWVAVLEGPAGSELVWVQTSPGSGAKPLDPESWFRTLGGGGGQSMTPGETIPTFTTEQYDTTGGLVNGGFTCPASHYGWWQMEWSVRWPGPSTGVRSAYLLSSFLGHSGTQIVPAAAAGDTALAGSAKVLFSAAYPICYLVMYHNHSGGMLCNASTNDYFQGFYLRPQ